MVLQLQPWLCCSPDGLAVVDNETVIVEIKCPFSREKLLIVDHDSKISFVNYLRNENDVLSLCATHEYYTQVQVQLYITNLTRAILFVYSTAQNASIFIERNDQFLSQAIPKLEHFYFSSLMKHLCT